MQRHAANIIKVAAVITAIPRWVIALLSADGLIMPDTWHSGWVVFSALSSVGMAIVEGVAFAYVFNAWRSCKQIGQGRVLVGLAAISAALFVALLTPSIAANVRGLTLGAWVTNDIALMVWAGVVAGSTISIVASIGYAEKTRVTETETKPTKTPQVDPQIRITRPEVPKLAEPKSLQVRKMRRWKNFSEEEQRQIMELSIVEIITQYGVSERTARNWRQHET
jgi:hypothetical protein